MPGRQKSAAIHWSAKKAATMVKASDPEATFRRTALRLAEAAWRDFDRRRSYEWKVNFALWPALGALGGFFWKENPQFEPLATISISIVLIIIAYTYWFKWSVGLWERNNLDQTVAHYYWARADGDTSKNESFPRGKFDATSPDFAPRRSWTETWAAGWRVFWRWSHGSQIMITLALIIIALAGALHSTKW
jgi:hypothetical protein